MRIISGFLKGRVIQGYNTIGTRPTMDRVKESLFAMIQDEIENSICLDLFAGSGSLGIEAISNGSKYVYFVDNNKIITKILTNNINNLNIKDKTKVMDIDYMEALTYFKKNNIKFNLIFLDPPYDKEIIDSILKIIDKFDLLEESGQVICEFRTDKLLSEYNSLYLIKSKKYNNKLVNIYRKITKYID